MDISDRDNRGVVVMDNGNRRAGQGRGVELAQYARFREIV